MYFVEIRAENGIGYGDCRIVAEIAEFGVEIRAEGMDLRFQDVQDVTQLVYHTPDGAGLYTQRGGCTKDCT
jgi:hypothetical protein